MKQSKRPALLLGLLLLVMLFAAAHAEDHVDLTLPAFTTTEAVWDDAGRMTSESVFDGAGNPAVNVRGFSRAEYTWDERGNLITEAYFGLNDEPVDIDAGYARVEYTYGATSNGQPYVLTEDRYRADGSRADLPGGYSYRRDTWDGDLILSSEYFDAEGKLTRPTGGYARTLYEVETGEIGRAHV